MAAERRKMSKQRMELLMKVGSVAALCDQYLGGGEFLSIARGYAGHMGLGVEHLDQMMALARSKGIPEGVLQRCQSIIDSDMKTFFLDLARDFHHLENEIAERQRRARTAGNN